MIKNVQKNDVNVEFSEKELSALVKLPSGDDYSLKLRLLHPIIPEQSTFKVLSTKVRPLERVVTGNLFKTQKHWSSNYLCGCKLIDPSSHTCLN